MSSKEGSGGFRKRKHDNFPHNQRREGKDVNSSSPVMLAFKCKFSVTEVGEGKRTKEVVARII